MARIEIAQNSVVTLYRDVDVAPGLQLVFSSASSREGYFARRMVRQFTDVSYVYRNGVLKLQETPQGMSQCNYISFTNPAFENKIIYASISDVVYKNNATVEILFDVDYWLTFMFDVEFRSCQIDREHMSEPDFQKAVANPWRRDILELSTAEDITFPDQMYNIPDREAPADFTYIADSFANPTGSGLRNLWVLFFVASGPITVGGAADRWRKEFTVPETMEDVATALEAGTPVQIRNQADVGLLPRACLLYAMPITKQIVDDIYDGTGSGDTIPLYEYGVKALTEEGLSSNIIGLWVVPGGPFHAAFAGYTGEGGDSTTVSITPTASSNPKAKRFPYSYAELVSPDGNVKELKYEMFDNMAGDIDFRVLLSLTGFPMFSVVPLDYEGTGANLLARMDWNDIPQVPYVIDSFLTYMSGVYNQAISVVSSGSEGALRRTFGGITNAVTSGITSGANTSSVAGPMPGLAAGGIAAGSGVLSALGGDALNLATSYNVARNVRMGENTNGDILNHNYDADRVLYRTSEYHPASSGGVWGTVFNTGHFAVRQRRLTAPAIEMLESYFDGYGYNSGRIGIPRVCNIVAGSGDAPHFVSVDGRQCTYVKTAGMKVISPMSIVSSYIETMFNNGQRFQKGDGL